MNKQNPMAFDFSQDKQDLLALLLEESGVELPAPHQIPRRPEGVTIPLSFAQQRLWFFHKLEPDNPLYNVSAAIRLEGELNLQWLEQSLALLMGRHEILRTYFQARGDEAIQVILPNQTLVLPVEDLQSLPAAEQAAVVDQWIAQEAQKPFDLTTPPLLRWHLLKLSTRCHVLVITMHHIITDGRWSVDILVRELAALYQSMPEQDPCPLADLPIQYADFACWQRQWLQGEVLDQQLTYWKQQLAGASGVLDLPSGHPRPPVQTFRGGVVQKTLPLQLSQQIQALSQRSGTTLFMTLLAGLYTLLYRYSSQSDLIVGAAIANRNRAELEGLIGFFVNMLTLRVEIAQTMTFRQLLAQVETITLGAFEHQDLPFEKLVEELQPVRDLSRNPLFQVGFALQNATLSDLQLPELTWSPLVSCWDGSVRFDLELHLEETEAGLQASWAYNQDLFNSDTITRMASQFQTLLQAVVDNPDQRLVDLPLLSEVEQQQLLVTWNQTHQDYPDQIAIHELIAQQVERQPEAIALTLASQSLTYRELDQQANQLAHHLQQLGLAPEQRVGLCLERSLAMIVGILGIWKAGGVYVPLDPAYPRDRLAFMLEDAQVAVLLTQANLVASLPPTGATVLCLDRDWGAIAQSSHQPPTRPVHPRQLAYLIYTSGSTGKPKGVQIEHRGICNLATVQRQLFDVTPSSRVLQFASLSFDASIWELVMALGSGARLCLGEAIALLPGPELLQLLQTQGITHATLPPSALAALPLAPLPQLQTLIVAGEACPLPLAQKWAVGRRFFNAYGPTEATVCATVFECQRWGQRLPIGRAIANTELYVLDANLCPVPIGVPGELYLGGVGLARGYLNRPDLSAERFVAHPFRPGARLYKTGDLVRYLPDGNLEFWGRLDTQIKLRGVRLELEEIETALTGHPEVREATVVLREDVPGSPRLVAYFVTLTPTPGLARTLRHHLKQQLPDYAIPAAFVELAALPLTPSGKVDRRALPQPEATLGEENSDYVAPQTPLETALADLWGQLLGLPQVGIHNNFFDLGGHSLLVIQLQHLLQVELNQVVSVVDLFRYPTVYTLAQFLQVPPSQGSPAENRPQDYASKQKMALNRHRQFIQQKRQAHE